MRCGPYEARAERLLGFGAEPENYSEKTNYRRGGRGLDGQPRRILLTDALRCRPPTSEFNGRGHEVGTLVAQRAALTMGP